MFVLYGRCDFLRLYLRLGFEYHLPIRYSVAMPGADELDLTNDDLVKAYLDGLHLLQLRGVPIFSKIEAANYQVPPHKKREYFYDLFRRVRPAFPKLLCIARMFR